MPRGKRKKEEGEFVLMKPRPPNMRRRLFGDQGRTFPLMIDGINFGSCYLRPEDIRPWMPTFVDDLMEGGGDTIRLRFNTEYQGQHRRLEEWVEGGGQINFTLGQHHLTGLCGGLMQRDAERWELEIRDVYYVPGKGH